MKALSILVILLMTSSTGTLAAQSRIWRTHSTSASLSDINGRVKVDNMPLIDILLHIASRVDKPVFIESGLAGSEAMQSRRSCEIDIRDPFAAMSELLEESRLTVADSPAGFPDRLYITRSEAAIGPDVPFLPLSQVNVELRLQQALPVHLEMVPLSMLAPMLEGVSGIEVSVDDGLDDRRNLWNPLRVSLHNDQRPLREALTDSLAREGLTFDVTSGGIRIRKLQ